MSPSSRTRSGPKPGSSHLHGAFWRTGRSAPSQNTTVAAGSWLRNSVEFGAFQPLLCPDSNLAFCPVFHGVIGGHVLMAVSGRHLSFPGGFRKVPPPFEDTGIFHPTVTPPLLRDGT